MGLDDLLNALDCYLSADSPKAKIEALTNLAAIYVQIDRHPQTISLSHSDMSKFKDLALEIDFDSVESLLSAITNTPPLLDKIGKFLSTPKIEPVSLPDILIRPEKPISRSIARIGISPDQVSVIFPEKREDFREVVKFTLGYEWDGDAWIKKVSGWGKAANMAAELGHRLLAAGIWIAPPTIEVKTMIIEEVFDPEYRRKVMVRTSGKYKGWFVLWWARSENCYDAARRITASRYDKPNVIVLPEYYDEVEDFARIYNFYISPAAKETMEKAKTMIDSALLLVVDEPEQLEQPNGKTPILAIPDDVGIDDDLADND